jgi:hypothetical protein
MNLDDALRCLFLRHLRALRLESAAAGDAPRAARLAELARLLAVEREKEAKCYRITLTGTPHAWSLPESEFVFYTRGDRAPAHSVSAEDAQLEQNLANAQKWLATFERAFHA